MRLDKGFKRGRYKKWVTITCEECNKKIEVSPCFKNKKYCSRFCANKALGKKLKGIPLSNEHKKKVSEGLRGHITKESVKEGFRKKYTTPEKYIINMIVPKKSFFQQLKPKKTKSSVWYGIKTTIRKCEICGFPFNKMLQIHHKYNKSNNKGNLAKLCPNCHYFLHSYNLSFEEAKKRINILIMRGKWYKQE